VVGGGGVGRAHVCTPREPLRDCAVYLSMNHFRRALLVLALCSFGCASSPPVTPSPPTLWPETVADTCPRRRISLECFRKPAVEAAMRRLVEHFRACHRPGMEPLHISLQIETRGGLPACVAHSPRGHPVSDCVASAVARSLVIPESPKEQQCSFRYPVAFE